MKPRLLRQVWQCALMICTSITPYVFTTPCIGTKVEMEELEKKQCGEEIHDDEIHDDGGKENISVSPKKLTRKFM